MPPSVPSPAWSIAVCVASLAACAPSPYRTAEQRFHADFRCGSGEARRVAGNTLRVSGCGKSALYTCVSSSDVMAGTTCVREYSDDDLRRFSSPAASSAQPPPGSFGVVKRSYDEANARHEVRAKLWLGGTNELYLLGIPKQALTAVHVQIALRAPANAEAVCNSLRVRINDRPFDARDVKSEPAPAAKQRVTGTFDFEIFKPLALAYAQLSVEACGRAYVAGPQQMPKLLEFFEVFSQIAVEVQAEGQHDAQPADADTLSL
jgi:hypothetical protein